MINLYDWEKRLYKNFSNSKLIHISILLKKAESESEDDEWLTLSDDDIVLNSLSYEQILEPSNNLTFTGCNASILKFSSRNTLENIIGKPVICSIWVQNGDTYDGGVTYAYGIVDSAVNKSPMATSMDIVIYDWMQFINNLDVKVWYDTLTFPISVKDFRDSLFNEIELRFNAKYINTVYLVQQDVTLPNDSVLLEKTIDDKQILAGNLLKFICQINGRYGQIRYNTFTYVSLKSSSLYPSDTVYPSYNIYPGGLTIASESILGTNYKIDSLAMEKYSTANIDGVQLIDKDNHAMAYAGENSPINIFTVSGNPLIYSLEQSVLNSIASNLYDEIKNISYVPLSLEMVGLPYLECGDYLNIQIGNIMKPTFMLHRVLSGEQALIDKIEAKGDEYLPIFKPNVDDKIREAISKAKDETRQLITEYDVAVQIMNDLAVNAIGGYQDYEDAESGGRIYYLSNRPITKNAQGQCVFEIGSTVFKSGGDGLYVSLDGGTTWINGYNATTGRLVVNVLNAIGISADWIVAGSLLADRIRGGTLLIGGINNNEGRILACTNESRTILNGHFDGVKDELFLFGEGSTLPYRVGRHYAVNSAITSIVQPVYFNVFENSTTPMAYFRAVWRSNPTDRWIERYVYLTEFTEPVYACSYVSNQYRDEYKYLCLYSMASFKGQIKYITKPAGSEPSETISSFTSTSSFTPSSGRRIYYYETHDSSYVLDGNSIEPQPPATKTPTSTLPDPVGSLSYIILDGQRYVEGFDLDWYFYDNNYPGSYIPAGTHVYYRTDRLVGKTENDEHTYECILQPNCYAVVIKDGDSGILQILFMCLGTQSYYTRIIDGGTPDTWQFDESIPNFVGEQDLWYTRLGGMYSCDLSITNAVGYNDYTQIPEVMRQIGIVIYGGVNHYPNVLFIETDNGVALGTDISNISDLDKFEGLYQMYETEDAGETFLPVVEGYLEEGNNFLDCVLDIATEEVDTKYYRLWFTRSDASFDATYDYTLKQLIFMTQIDNNGIKTNYIEADGGNFGILQIVTDEDDAKLVIYKSNNDVYSEEYSNFTTRIEKTITFVPYNLRWLQDAQISIDFNADSTGATENLYTATVILTKKSASTTHRLGKFYLNSDGSLRSGSTGATSDPIPTFSELIDHEWGKEYGEYYRLKYVIKKRSFITGDSASIRAYDSNNTAQVGTTLTPDQIISDFRGTFEGQATFNELHLNDWSFDYENQKMFIDTDEDEPSEYDGTEIGIDRIKLEKNGDYAYLNRGELQLNSSNSNIDIDCQPIGSTEVCRIIMQGDSPRIEVRNSNDIVTVSCDSTHPEFEIYSSDYISRLRKNILEMYNRGMSITQYKSLDFSNHGGVWQQDWDATFYERHSLLTPQDIELHYQNTDTSTNDNYQYTLNVYSNDISKREIHSNPSSDVTYGLTWVTSDERVKEDIIDLDKDLSVELIDNSEPKKFRYKGTSGTHYGMIAQSVRKQLDDLGEEDARLERSMGLPEDRTGIDDQRTIDYNEYIPHLINYVKELKAEIISLKEEIKKLKGE